VAHTRSDPGFTLIEVLAALVMLATAVVATAGLFGVAAVSIRAARVQTWSALLARDKLDELRVRSWPPAVSPADSLQHDVPSFVEYLDSSGRSVSETGAPASSAAYIRRWSVQPLPADPANTMVIQVLVTTAVAGRTGIVVATMRTHVER